MSNRIIRLPEVIKKTGLGRSTVYRLLDKGQFPMAVSLGARAVGWVEAEVERWIQERMQSRLGTHSPIVSELQA